MVTNNNAPQAAASQKKYLNQAGLAYFYARLKEVFVKGEEGKGLSHNDFTDELKAQLELLDPGDLLGEKDAMTFEEIDEIIESINEQFDKMEVENT